LLRLASRSFKDAGPALGPGAAGAGLAGSAAGASLGLAGLADDPTCAAKVFHWSAEMRDGSANRRASAASANTGSTGSLGSSRVFPVNEAKPESATARRSQVELSVHRYCASVR